MKGEKLSQISNQKQGRLAPERISSSVVFLVGENSKLENSTTFHLSAINLKIAFSSNKTKFRLKLDINKQQSRKLFPFYIELKYIIKHKQNFQRNHVTLNKVVGLNKKQVNYSLPPRIHICSTLPKSRVRLGAVWN